MSDHAGLHQATLRAANDGQGHTHPEVRRAVFVGKPPADLAALVALVRDEPWRVTDADLDGLRGACTEDQIFEVIVAASLGAADTRLQAALRALEDA